MMLFKYSLYLSYLYIDTRIEICYLRQTRFSCSKKQVKNEFEEHLGTKILYFSKNVF